MSDISLRHELAVRGITDDVLRTMLRDGSLTRLRRGAYLDAAGIDEATAGGTVESRHRQLVDATVRQLSGGFVVSHMSAALLHGLPTWRADLRRVQLTNGRSGGGKIRADVRVRGLALRPDEIVALDGYRVTSVARTVLDLCCSLPLERSVPIGDAALRAGLDASQLATVIARGVGRTGIGRARAAAPLLDARSESPGESVSRVIFHVRGLPTPILQYEVYAPDGRLVGRSDVAWPELRTLGEFDGRTKYGRLLTGGQLGEDVLFAEKVREDALREQGWEVVRWTWKDLQNPSELIRRVEAAFERGRRRPG